MTAIVADLSAGQQVPHQQDPRHFQQCGMAGQEEGGDCRGDLILKNNLPIIMFVKYLAAIGTHMDEFSKVKLGNVRSTRTCYCLPRVILGSS